MATWSGDITMKANGVITFYKADKNDKIIGEQCNFSFPKQISVSVSGAKEITQGSTMYIKSCTAIINALKDAAESSGSNKGTLNKINYLSNAVCYLKVSGSVSAKSKASLTSSSQNTTTLRYESGVMKIKLGSKNNIWNSPGGYAIGQITASGSASSGKYIEFNIKDAVYSMRNGYKYIQVSSGIKSSIKSKLNQDVAVGTWICIDGDKVKVDNSVTKSQKSYNKVSSSSANNASDEVDATTTSTTINLKSGANKVDLTTNSTLDDLMAKSMHGIFGIPYQWMAIADRRIDGSSFGRKYAEKIAARMPLLFITPCRPAFLSGASKDQKDNLLSGMFSGDKDITASVLDSFLGDMKKDGISRYYTTNFAYEEYFRYVNVCCNTTAKVMHLDGSKGSLTRTTGVNINGKEIKDFSKYNWYKALQKDFTDYFSSASSVPFYINANVSVNESISNDTMESSLAGTVKSKSEQAKELSFLLNSASSASGGGAISWATDKLTDLTNKFQSNASAANFITSVGNSMSSIAAGGSMMFPELWSSSSMGRSYQIDIKLRSPDGDSLSVYLNVLVPLYHLLCLAAPQMMNDNYNIYYSPFLVKAYCKSMFNIDMGIITSMDITKGKEGDWNANGVPTSIDVSLTIKDLYDVFSITPYEDKIDLKNPLLDALGVGSSSGAKRIVRNTAMMDYLCNNAGLNLNQNEIVRQATVYKMLRGNTIRNWPSNKWLQLQQIVDNKLAKIYRPGSNNRK